MIFKKLGIDIISFGVPFTENKTVEIILRNNETEKELCLNDVKALSIIDWPNRVMNVSPVIQEHPYVVTTI